jgi:hypothetical protein
VGPVAPAKPVGPVKPVCPVFPVDPVAPVTPVAPVLPVLPGEPPGPSQNNVHIVFYRHELHAKHPNTVGSCKGLLSTSVAQSTYSDFSLKSELMHIDERMNSKQTLSIFTSNRNTTALSKA